MGADLFRNGFQRQHVFPAEDHHSLHRVLQFPHVAGPGVPVEQREHLGGEAKIGTLVALGELGEKVLRQERNVVPPFSKRRNRDLNDRKPIKQIAPKRSFGDHLLEIAVRRRDDPDIDSTWPVLPDAIDLSSLKCPQDLRLQCEGYLSDFVQKERTAVRSLEFPRSVRVRPGEGALAVPEQLRLDEVMRERTAIHRDEPGLSSGAVVMNRSGHELLAGAGLPRWTSTVDVVGAASSRRS